MGDVCGTSCLLPLCRCTAAVLLQDEARLGTSPGPTPEALSEMLAKHKEKQQRLRDAAAARSPDRSPMPPASSQGAWPRSLGAGCRLNEWCSAAHPALCQPLVVECMCSRLVVVCGACSFPATSLFLNIALDASRPPCRRLLPCRPQC